MPEPSTGSTPSLRPATRGDLAGIAALHQGELRYGLFPRLGRRFLRHYHACLLDSPEAVSLVVSDQHGLAGFLVGSVDHHRHHDWMLRRCGLRLAAAGVAGLLAHPRTLVLFARTRLRRYLRRLRRVLPSSSIAPAQAPMDLRLGVLLHVAVAPARRGEGLGRMLTERFVTEASERGVEELQLVTADDDAAAFYRRLSWQKRETRRDADGTTVITFAYELGERDPQANDGGTAEPPAP